MCIAPDNGESRVPFNFWLLTEINCGYPGSLENGMLNITGDFKLGSLVAYACYGGFRLEGPSTRTCLKNNSWSGSQPKCISK